MHLQLNHTFPRYFQLLLLAVLMFLLIACDGGDRDWSSEAEIVSNRFQLQWELDGHDLLLAIDTDLPDTAKVGVSAERVYFEVGNDEAYSRYYFNETEPISEWRNPRRIPIDDEAWKADLIAFQSEMSAISKMVAFEIARIEDQIQVYAVIHLNQPDPRFGGPGNPNLSGAAVSESSNVIKAEIKIPWPLSGTPPPARSRHVAYNMLKVGESYRLQDVTSLIPFRSVEGLSSEETMEAIQRRLKLPAGQVIRVIVVDHTEGNNPLYAVELVGNEGVRGWIDSTALIGLGVVLP